jgi:hypothetical protein
VILHAPTISVQKSDGAWAIFTFGFLIVVAVTQIFVFPIWPAGDKHFQKEKSKENGILILKSLLLHSSNISKQRFLVLFVMLKQQKNGFGCACYHLP